MSEIEKDTSNIELSIPNKLLTISNAYKNGNPVIVAIKPNGKGKYYNFKLNSNVLLSSYGKDNLLNYVITARNEGRILYVNKSSQQTNGEGVQFPNSILSADYNNNLAHYKQTVNNYSMSEIEKDTSTVKNGNMQESENNSSDESFSFGSPMQQARENLARYDKVEIIKKEPRHTSACRGSVLGRGDRT